MQAINILLSDARGVYIPRDFVTTFTPAVWGLDPKSWAVETCKAGPNGDCDYWMAWSEICNKAEFHQDGHVWYLHHDGDLWAICEEQMSDEEKQNFGLED